MKTMRTPNQDAALAAFVNAAIGDGDQGYPHGVAFVGADDSPEAAHIAWRYLVEGRPTVLINENKAQLLLQPLRASLVNRLRRRIRVQVSYREREAGSTEASPSFQAELDRHALESFDSSALATA
jgi:hypothetical protein